MIFKNFIHEKICYYCSSTARRCELCCGPGSRSTSGFSQTSPTRLRLNPSSSKPKSSTSHASRLSRALAPRVTPSVPTDSIRRLEEKTRRSTKPFCASPAWPRIHSDNCTSAASTPTCNTASTMCSCRKAFLVSARNCETRFADSVSLITGALPAQFGFRTTGVIDIHTKSGAVFQQGEASIYGGSFDTIMPSFQYGGVTGKLSSYVSASYFHSGIGIENPTSSSDPIHDDTDQYKLFGYLSYIFDETSRLTLLLSGNHSDFQIPNNPGQMGAFTDMGRSTFDSSKLDENQTEQSSYAILTYQKKVDDFNMQASIFTRYSSVLFRPDEVGDLIFNGVASRVDRDILSNGIEFDASYKLNDQHTLRGGFLFQRTVRHRLGRPRLCFPSMRTATRRAMCRNASSITATSMATSTASTCRTNGSLSNN